jgi:hypothetical protein
MLFSRELFFGKMNSPFFLPNQCPSRLDQSTEDYCKIDKAEAGRRGIIYNQVESPISNLT